MACGSGGDEARVLSGTLTVEPGPWARSFESDEALANFIASSEGHCPNVFSEYVEAPLVALDEERGQIGTSHLDDGALRVDDLSCVFEFEIRLEEIPDVVTLEVERHSGPRAGLEISRAELERRRWEVRLTLPYRG